MDGTWIATASQTSGRGFMSLPVGGTSVSEGKGDVTIDGIRILDSNIRSEMLT